MLNKTQKDNEKLMSKSGGYLSIKDSAIQSTSHHTHKSKSETIISRISEIIDAARGTIAGSIFTFVVCTVGPGCLALAYAFRNVGLIVGIFLILFGAIISYFTLDLILISAEYLPENLRGQKPLRDISYQTLALHSYGNRLSRALQVIMMLQYFGQAVGYVVAFAGFIDTAYQLYRPSGSEDDGLSTTNHDDWPDSIYGYSVVGVCYGIVFPLALLRSVTSLRFTSLLGFIMSIYAVIVVTVQYFLLCNEADKITDNTYNNNCVWHSGYDMPDDGIIRGDPWDLTKGFITAFPLVVFTYTAHPFVMPLYVELERPSIKRMRTVFFTGFSVCGVLYLMISISGFLLFLDTVCGNIMMNNFDGSTVVTTAALGIGFVCIFALPIFTYNFRRMIGMLFMNKSPTQISTRWHIAITFLFISSIVVLGIFVDSIAVVFGFLGSTVSPVLCYILPAVFFVKMAPPGMYEIRKRFATLQAVVIGMISLGALAYKLYSPGDLECADVN